MESQFLDKNGVQILWTKVKSLVSGKQDKLEILPVVDDYLKNHTGGIISVATAPSPITAADGSAMTVVNTKIYTPQSIVTEAGANAKATSSDYGLIKIGYSTNNKNYAVQLDNYGHAYVNVPWYSSSYSLPSASLNTMGGVKAYFGNTSGEIYADIQQDQNTLYIRAGQFQQTSASGSVTTHFTFRRLMNTMGGSASSVVAILGDSKGQSTNPGYMGSLAVDGTSYTGFNYRASNTEKGNVYYIAIGRW